MKLHRLVIALALFAAFETDSWGQSQQPSARPGTDSTQKQPAEQDKPPVQSAPIAEIKEPVKAQEKPKADSNEGHGKLPETWSLSDKIAVIASVVAFLQFLALIATVFVMRRTAERQLRAYIMVDTARIDNLKVGEKPVAHLTFKNSGQTPAREVSHWCAMGFDTFPHRIPIKSVDEDEEFNPRPLAPQGVIHTRTDERRALNQATMDAIVEGTYAVYVVGQIRYFDAFGVRRETDFMLYAGGPIGVGGDLAGYKTGNRIT